MAALKVEYPKHGPGPYNDSMNIAWVHAISDAIMQHVADLTQEEWSTQEERDAVLPVLDVTDTGFELRRRTLLRLRCGCLEGVAEQVLDNFRQDWTTLGLGAGYAVPYGGEPRALASLIYVKQSLRQSLEIELANSPLDAYDRLRGMMTNKMTGACPFPESQTLSPDERLALLKQMVPTAWARLDAWMEAIARSVIAGDINTTEWASPSNQQSCLAAAVDLARHMRSN